MSELETVCAIIDVDSYTQSSADSSYRAHVHKINAEGVTKDTLEISVSSSSLAESRVQAKTEVSHRAETQKQLVQSWSPERKKVRGEDDNVVPTRLQMVGVVCLLRCRQKTITLDLFYFYSLKAD